MTPQDLNGKRLMLLLCAVNDAGEDDWVITTGIMETGDSELIFCQEPNVRFPLPDDTMNRIKAMTDDLHELAPKSGAEYFLSLSVGGKPKNAVAGEYFPTGLKWPSD